MIAPWDVPEQWDTVFMMGIPTPGVARVKSAKRRYKWDAKETKGRSGATCTFQGEPLADIDVEVDLWTEEQIVIEWPVFLQVIMRSTTSPVPAAMAVEHPALAMLEIRDVVVTDIRPLEHEGGGLWRTGFSLLEYRVAVPAGGTPVVSLGGFASVTKAQRDADIAEFTGGDSIAPPLTSSQIVADTLLAQELARAGAPL